MLTSSLESMPVECPEGKEYTTLRLLVSPATDRKKIEEVVASGLDWPCLLNLAARHGVRPRMIQTLSELDWLDIPKDSKEGLLSFLRHHTACSLALSGKLAIIADKLTQREIRFAAFKGPVLAVSLYGHPSRREYCDIDIIVDEKTVPAAEDVLADLNYRPVYGTSAFRNAFLGYQRQFSFVGDNPVHLVDLHWAFTARHVPFPLDAQEIWGSLEKVVVGGHPIPTLCTEDLPLLLAGHGTKARWTCLKWVCDFATVVHRHQDDAFWIRLLRRAALRGCEQPIFQAMQLAERLLGVQMQAHAPELASSLSKSMLPPNILDGPARRAGTRLTVADFKLCETFAQRLRLVARLVFTRTTGDYTSFPLPNRLWRMYYVTRPFRLAGKIVRELLKIRSPSKERFPRIYY
jgi:hypothetical protein